MPDEIKAGLHKIIDYYNNIDLNNLFDRLTFWLLFQGIPRKAGLKARRSRQVGKVDVVDQWEVDRINSIFLNIYCIY